MRLGEHLKSFYLILQILQSKNTFIVVTQQL